MKNKITNKFKWLVVAAVMLAVSFTASAAFSFTGGPAQLVKSTAGPTNQVVGTNGIFLYPSYVAANTSVTNVIPFSVNTGSHVAIETDVQITGPTAATTTNIIWQLGRSVRAVTDQNPSVNPTNAAATGWVIDWFGTITNTLPASAAGSNTYTATALFGPVTGQSSGAGDGAATTFYLGWVTTPANVTMTNYSVWFNTQ